MQHSKSNKIPLLFQVKNSLGPLELEVMLTIWKSGKTTVKEVLNILRQKRSIAYTTIMTVMDKLYKKGFLVREKVKKVYYYFPITKENNIITFSLSQVFRDLAVDYGRKKVLYSTAALIPTFSNKLIKAYKAPVGYGLSFTLVLTLLGFSAFDLLQNLSFFGAFDYFSLLRFEPSFFINHFYLFILALSESLPIVNIITTIISLFLIIILAKKLFKLTHFRGAI